MALKPKIASHKCHHLQTHHSRSGIHASVGISTSLSQSCQSGAAVGTRLDCAGKEGSACSPFFRPHAIYCSQSNVSPYFQCVWASLVAQLVKNPPAMPETWVLSLGWEDPLKKGKATDSSILAR